MATTETPAAAKDTTKKPPTTANAANAAVDELREKLKVRPPGEAVEWINFLVYGEAGAGKTYLAGTAEDDPRTSPVLFCDVEGGVTTIRHRTALDVVPIRTIDQLQNLHNDLYRSIADGKMYYKTVVIDSLTELTDLDMKTIMRQAYNANPDKVDMDVPSPREWGKTRNHMRSIVRAFKDLPCHVIFTAGQGIQSEEGRPPKYHPGLSGKLRHEIPGFVDIVGYLTSEVNNSTLEKTRKIQFTGTNRVVAKDRTAALGDILENTTIPAMWDLIQNT